MTTFNQDDHKRRIWSAAEQKVPISKLVDARLISSSTLHHPQFTPYAPCLLPDEHANFVHAQWNTNGREINQTHCNLVDKTHASCRSWYMLRMICIVQRGVLTITNTVLGSGYVGPSYEIFKNCIIGHMTHVAELGFRSFLTLVTLCYCWLLWHCGVG